MSTDIYTTLPSSNSPTLRARVIQGVSSLPKFEVSPSALPIPKWGCLTQSQSLRKPSYQPIDTIRSVSKDSQDPMDECPEMARSWQKIPSPERDESVNRYVKDTSMASLSDWDIVCKPLSLSESQYPATFSTTSLTDVIGALSSSPSLNEGIVVSEPMEIEESQPFTTHMSTPHVCTTLALYKPNPILQLISQKPTKDMNYVTPKSKSSPLKSSWKGLQNLGNTCYMNSSLQALLSLDGFVDTLITSSSHDSEFLIPSVSPNKILVEQLVHVFRLLRGEEISDKIESEWTTWQSNSQDVNPTQFKEVVDEKTPLFVGYQQHDAHEFMTTLLDLLHDELKLTVSMETTHNPEIPSNTTVIDPSDTQDDSNYVIVSGATTASFEGRSQNHAKKARLGTASDSFDFDVVGESEEDCVDENNSQSLEQRRMSLSNLNMEGIEELLTNTNAVDIPYRRGSWNGQEQTIRGWKPFWKSKSRSGYLIGGGATAASLISTTAHRRTRYHSIDQSWQVIPKDILQSPVSPVHEDTAVNTKSTSDPRHQRLYASSSEKSHMQKESPSSLVDAYFTTEIRSHLTCDSCKFSRSQLETFRCLSLELVDSDTSMGKTLPGFKFNQTLQDSLRKFLAPEKREIKCEKCFFDWATKTTEITKLPNALILHLKRFIVDVSPDYMTITCRKNHTPVEFSNYLSLDPLDDNGVLAEYLATDIRIPTPLMSIQHPSMKIDMKQTCDEVAPESIYGLRSIVHHVGSSAEYGHYTSTVHRTTPSRDDEASSRCWLYCNDELVSDLYESQVFHTSSQTTAYLFLFELQHNLQHKQ